MSSHGVEWCGVKSDRQKGEKGDDLNVGEMKGGVNDR
jgi:hypothetical protein